METYGKLLFQGEMIPKDEEKAVKILTDAVEKHKSSNAKLQLSKIILSHQSFDINDKNENINWPLAKQYSKEAADAGNIEAILHYADLSMKEKRTNMVKFTPMLLKVSTILKKQLIKEMQQQWLYMDNLLNLVEHILNLILKQPFNITRNHMKK